MREYEIEDPYIVIQIDDDGVVDAFYMNGKELSIHHWESVYEWLQNEGIEFND